MNPPINVLLIEGNLGDVQLVKEKLCSASSPSCIHLEWVDCLQKGLDYLKTNPVDTVLVELSLPDSNGLDTLQRVLDCAPQTSVIVLTGLINEETGTRALQAGAQDFLIKDQVDGRLLVRVIQYGMHRKQLETQLEDALEFTQRIVTSSPAGIFTYRRSGECLSANAAAAQMVGGTIEQLKSQNFHQLESWKKSGLYTLAMQAINTGTSVVGDVHVATSFGRDAWYTAQFVTCRSGGEELLLMIFSDITERKQVDAALKASEKRFRTWIENSSDVVTVLDATGTIQYESPSVKRVLGYKPEELLGKVAFDFIHPKDQEQVLAIFIEAIQNPESIVSTEFRFLHRDGTWRFLEAVGHTYVDEHNEVVGLIHSRDITERKQAEEAVAAMQKRFQSLIENAPDGIALLGMDGKLRQVTPSTQQILGYTLEEAEGQDPAHLTHADDLPALLEALSDLIQNPEKVVRMQYRFQHKDGSWRWLDSIITNLIAEPSVQSIVFNYRDITERKWSEEQIALQVNLLSAVGSAAIATDLDERVTYWNAAAERLYGWSAGEALGSDVTELIMPRRSQEQAAEIMKQLASGKSWSGEICVQRKNGSLFPAFVSVSPLLDAQGNLIGIISISNDITELKREAEARQEREARLKSVVENVGGILWSIDSQYRLSMFNSRYADAIRINMNHESHLGEIIPPLSLPENVRHEWRARYERALHGEAFQDEVVEVLDGERYDREYSFNPIFGTEGQAIGVTCLGRDITDRKRAEDTLRESEDRYRDLVEHIRDLIGTHDLQGNILSINPAATHLLGFDMDDLLRMNMRDLLAPEVQSGFDNYLTTIERDGHAHGLMILQTMGGERRIWEYDNTLRTDSTNGPVVRALARDVTERKLAEKALKEKERLLSEAQRIGHIGSWSYDIASDTMKFSDEMYRLLDVQPEEFHHNHEEFLALVYPSDRPSAVRWFANIAEATQSKDLDFRIFHKNGELCYLHCTGVVEFDTATKPIRFIGTAQDVTERRTAEIQIDQQIKRLTALSEIDRAIISSFDQRYTLNVILSNIISLLQVDAVSILLLDSEQNILTYTAGQGFRTKMMETARMRVGEGHAGRSAKERRMVRIPDLRETTNLAEFNTFVTTEGFVSYIAMPLIAKGNVKGVLEVYQRSMLQPYQDWLEFFHTLVGQTAIAIDNTTLFENLRETNQELVQAYDATIEGWSRAMDLRDRETEGHTQRVTKMTLALARSMGIEESRLIHIRRGALLHDIGKLGVPDHILFKPGKLNHEEREMIEKHVDFAYEMLAPISYLKPALNIPYFHHEKWDGTGYPLGLKGERIPLEARIFALADVWDALLSDRPYRQAWTREKTIEYIRVQTGHHFDPRVVECFLEMINRTDG